jgi:hypothetical protein
VSKPVSLAAAALELGMSVRNLHRELAAGAPVVRQGKPGRGRSTLVSVEAIAAWRRLRSASQATDVLQVFAAEIPELLAGAMYDAFIAIEGPHKRPCADVLAGAWFRASNALLNRLREKSPAVPFDLPQPDKIVMLCRIFEHSGKVRP